LEVAEERRHVAAVVRDGALLRPPGRLAVATQIAGDDFVRRRKEIELRLPVLERAGEAVDEEERGRAPPLTDEVQITLRAARACARRQASAAAAAAEACRRAQARAARR